MQKAKQRLKVLGVNFNKKSTPKMGYKANYLHVVYPDFDEMFANLNFINYYLLQMISLSSSTMFTL